MGVDINNHDNIPRMYALPSFDKYDIMTKNNSYTG